MEEGAALVLDSDEDKVEASGAGAPRVPVSLLQHC